MTQPPYAAGPSPEQGAGPAAACYRHPDRPTGLACTRCGRPICTDCMHPAAVGFHCPQCVAEGRAAVRQPSVRRTAVARARRGGVVTTSLIGLNVLAFVATVVAAGSLTSNYRSDLFLQFAMWGPAVDAGEWWRLITSTFLHYGPAHIAVNMFSLYIIGRGVESYLGTVKYLLLYLLSGLGGSIAVWVFSPMALAAGASGAVFGLLGAAGAIMLRNKQDMRALIGILVLNVMISLLPGISLAAHLGGFVTGGAVAGILLLTTHR